MKKLRSTTLSCKDIGHRRTEFQTRFLKLFFTISKYSIQFSKYDFYYIQEYLSGIIPLYKRKYELEDEIIQYYIQEYLSSIIPLYKRKYELEDETINNIIFRNI